MPGASLPHTWCWQDERLSVRWVFGASWFPTLSARSERLLYRQLREQGTQWVASHGTQMRLIGAISPAWQASMVGQCVSAAVAFVRAHPQGSHALCLEVQEQGFWLVACVDGRLLSQTDCWFDDDAQLQEALRSLCDCHSDLQVVQSRWSPSSVGSEDDTPAFLVKQNPWCRFKKATTSYHLWLWIGLALLLVVGVGLWAFAGRSGIADDGLARTDRQAHDTAPAVMVHSPATVVSVLKAWHELPVDPAGWLLQRVDCEVHSEHVSCDAQYKRHKPSADNEGLKQHQPPGWMFQPGSIDQAHLRRTLALQRLALLSGGRLSLEQGLTELQRFSAQAASLTLGLRSQLGPLGDASFGQRARADQLTPVVTRSLAVELTLRQASALSQLAVPIRWQEIDLEINQGAHIDKRHGYLMLSLKGEWIESF